MTGAQVKRWGVRALRTGMASVAALLAFSATALALTGANTNASTTVTSTAATLHGWPWCTSSSCNYYFRWGPAAGTSYTASSPAATVVGRGFNSGVTLNATALQPGAAYKFQICAGIGAGQTTDTCYGPQGAPNTYSTFTTLSGIPPAPMGPGTPSGGWHVAMADDFNAPLGAAAGDDDLWYPNRFCDSTGDLPPDSPSQQLNDFNPSQVSLAGGVLSETARYDPGEHAPFASGDPEVNYVSGDLTSSTSCAGQGYKGFDWIPDEGDTWAFEVDAQFPPDTGDLWNAFWSATEVGWDNERDFFEGRWNSPYFLDADWMYETDPMQLDIYGTTPGGSGSLGPGLPFDPSAAMHRYTYVVYPNQSWSLYVDGRLQTWVGDNGVAPTETAVEPNPHDPMFLLLTYALAHQNADGSWSFTDPGFTSGSRSFRINSVAVYQDGAHAGQDFAGGGAAPGTVIAAR